VKDVKDVTKLLSEKATRFLPVDMKDRLKSAFNRTAATAAPAPGPADDVPDYSAIFNANKVPGAQKKPRFNGPLEPPQLSQPPGTATKSTGLKIAQDIEEAEIVTEPINKPLVQPEWEATAMLTTKSHKAEAFTPSPAAEPAPAPQPEVKAASLADDVPDYTAIFKTNKRSAESKPAAHFDVSAFDRNSEDRNSETKATVFRADEAKPELRTEAGAANKIEDKIQKPAPIVTETTTREQPPMAEKHKSRFGDFSSTESVRLKVEKRPEERRAEAPQPPVAASGFQPASEPAKPVPKAPEAKARNTEEHLSAGFAYEAKPIEQPKEAYRGSTPSVAPRAASSEPNNLNRQKETFAMDAKAHETDNGATTVKADGNVAAIAIERNSKFSGQLKFSGAIAIDGQVEGELVAERVVVHEGGVVNATVEGNTVIIAGTVKGDIYARAELEILPSGVVHGSVTSPTISVRRGGRVEGRCAIGVPRQ
jgi:cytoskeletal protein CcmA (bactofilin family)